MNQKEGEYVSEAARIYNFRRIIERELRKLGRDINGQVLLRYYQRRVAEGISQARIVKCLNTLRILSKLFGKRFETATKENIVELVSRIEGLEVGDYTKHDYKVIIKKFYQWLRQYDDGEYPPEVKWIKDARKPQSKLTKSDLLTFDDVTRLVNATVNIRDKALMLVLMESGRRIGEILTLRIGDVEFDDVGAKLHVNGKTGNDFSRIISSSVALAQWLDNHPMRDNPKAPIWIALEERGRPRQISYGSARWILNECAKRAGFKKRVYFHLFRHTRATQAATKLNQMQMCAMLGWKFSSKMPSIYVHLSGEDIDEAQSIMNGVPHAKKTEREFNPKECPRCREKNSPISKFCIKCGAPLDLITAVETDEKKSKVERLMNKLAEDPEKLDRLLALVEQ